MLKIKAKKGKVTNKDSFRACIRSSVVSRNFKVFIQRSAERRNIKGVLNDETYGLSINVEGDKDKIYDLVSKIYEDKPHSVVIESINVDKVEYVGYVDFQIPKINIEALRDSLSFTDTAICPDCIEELFNPKNRRYLYPFINCSHCGPRLSSIKGMPYERDNTTMGQFELCSKCLKEYQDSDNRRFNNHINSCWECGPKLSLKHRDSLGEYNYQDREALDKAIEFLNKGSILVFKDIAGYKVCSNSTYEDASLMVENNIKDAESYLMLKGVRMAESYARINEKERESLLSHPRPKVLLRLLEDARIQDKIKRDKRYFKFQLPCSGLDYAIFKNVNAPLLIKDCESLTLNDISKCLKGVSWSLLSSDMDFGNYYKGSETRIFTSKDGTLSKNITIKRSKGYTLNPLIFGHQFFNSILALGCSKHSSFTLAKDDKFYLSPYLGDLSKEFNQVNYKKILDLYMEIFKIEPKAIAIEEGESSYLGDLAQELSKRFGVRILEVESNHARIVSSMLESNLDENMIGIVLRSGLESNSVFELNFYLASLSDSKIIGCFESLEGLFKINDDYSLKLELLAEVKDEFCKDLYPIEIRDLGDKFMILSEPILNGVIADTKRAVSQVRIAAKLYNSIVEGIYKMSLRLRRRLKINKLSLAGDMLENVFLLTNVYQKLKSKDFEVSISASVPFNDSGISLGQFVVVDNIIKEEIKNSSDS